MAFSLINTSTLCWPRISSSVDAMARAILPEDLWSLVAAHLPTNRGSPKGGQPGARVENTGCNPTDRDKLGLKHDLFVWGIKCCGRLPARASADGPSSGFVRRSYSNSGTIASGG